MTTVVLVDRAVLPMWKTDRCRGTRDNGREVRDGRVGERRDCREVVAEKEESTDRRC